jgi:hypothetical protein
MVTGVLSVTARASALGIVAISLLAAADTPRPSNATARPEWTAIKWPFPIDQWGFGNAFECAPAVCGTRLQIYVRAKIGFCDCARGVADDQEVDRVADVELLSPSFVPNGAGRPITVGSMQGRSRAYLVRASHGDRPVLSFAFAANCNVAIATLAGGLTLPAQAEQAALDFLNSHSIVNWAKAELGS